MAFIAFDLLLGHVRKAGLLKLDEQCATPWVGAPFQKRYLGGYAPPIEGILCILVGFFHPLFQPEAAGSAPYIDDFLASFVACITIPLFEASRANRPLLLAFPLILGILYQNLGGGVLFPLYWALFLVTTTPRKSTGTQIDQANAEAVLFGVGMGFVLPTAAMIYLGTVESIAFWQAFPLWMSVFQQLHLFFRPSRLHGGSGHRTVQATYVSIFIAATIVHLRALFAYNFDSWTIIDAYTPSLAIPDAKKGHTAMTSSIHFLQWDMVFIFGSTLLASLWFAESVVQGVLLMTWSAVSTVILGPGAAVSGAFIWREERLKNERQKLSSPSKRVKVQ